MVSDVRFLVRLLLILCEMFIVEMNSVMFCIGMWLLKCCRVLFSFMFMCCLCSISVNFCVSGGFMLCVRFFSVGVKFSLVCMLLVIIISLLGSCCWILLMCC